MRTDRWLFREKRVSSQSRKQIHQEIDYTAMPGVFYVTDIFQEIIDGFNHGTLTEHESVV